MKLAEVHKGINYPVFRENMDEFNHNGDGDLKYVDKIDIVLDNMEVELLGKKD